jgi:tetratricopeptide (TPR) repeat protein
VSHDCLRFERQSDGTPDEALRIDRFDIVGRRSGQWDAQAVCAALGVIGHRGDVSHCPLLARLLHSDDCDICAAAEQALWTLWLRSGGAVAQSRLCRAVQLMQAERFPQALALLDTLIEDRPDFAEAYNQRAIARYLREDYCGAIADCRRALGLNPQHFGAMAGMGHCLAELGRNDDALQCYYAALHIHPRMEGIRQSIRAIHAVQRQCRSVGACNSRPPKP